MATQVGSTRFDSARHLVDEQLDALKSNVEHVVERVLAQADDSSLDVRIWMKKASELAKAHPFATVGIGVGVGIGLVYGVIRFVRS